MTPAAKNGIHSHLHRPDGDADEAEQHEIRPTSRTEIPSGRAACRHGARASRRACRGRTCSSVSWLPRFLAVELGAFPQHLVDADDLRAVRVFHGFAPRVVLAVDRGPVLRDHAGGEPQPEAEEMTDRRMQIERPVRLAAVQVNGDGGDRDVGDTERVDHVTPPRQIENPCKHRALLVFFRQLLRHLSAAV